MVNAIEQWDDCAERIRIPERFQCEIQLRGLHRDPEHIGRRDFGGDGDVYLEMAERTFQAKLFRMLFNRLGPDNHCDGSAGVRQTCPDQASHAASSENRMSHWFGHSDLLRSRSLSPMPSSRSPAFS